MQIPQSYLDRIRALVPNLSLDSVDINHEGMINDVVIVGGELVFRFPKSDRARGALQQEARVLEIVRRHVSVPVPRFEHLDDDMAVYRFLPGQPLTRSRLLHLPLAQRRSVLADLATFLRQLHAIPNAEIEASGIGPSDAVRTRDDWVRFLARVEEHLFPLLMRYQREAVLDLFEPVVNQWLDLSHTPRLIHGDLGVYHVLLNPETVELSGVIDFGTAGLGDPATDLALLLSIHGELLVSDVFATYPELAEHLDRARFKVGVLELEWALAGITRDDRSLLLAHIGGARDVLPVGFPLADDDAEHGRDLGKQPM